LGLAGAADYSHRFDAFSFGFSSPIAIRNVDWGSGSAGSPVNVNLPDGQNFFVWNSKLYSWEDRDPSTETIIEIWSSDG